MLKQRGIFFSTDAFFGLIIVFMGIAMITSLYVLPHGNDDLVTMERLARDSAISQTNVDSDTVFKSETAADPHTSIKVNRYTCFGELDFSGCAVTGSLCGTAEYSMPKVCQLNKEYDPNDYSTLDTHDSNVEVHLP
ncbi:MAG: hypothetical protein J7K00_05555 [Candidatus Diapherotrites archaeon]|nr:hypothetical protein [Candidatus Diapherotrites archaeon]